MLFQTRGKSLETMGLGDWAPTITQRDVFIFDGVPFHQPGLEVRIVVAILGQLNKARRPIVWKRLPALRMSLHTFFHPLSDGFQALRVTALKGDWGGAAYGGKACRLTYECDSLS